MPINHKSKIDTSYCGRNLRRTSPFMGPPTDASVATVCHSPRIVDRLPHPVLSTTRHQVPKCEGDIECPRGRGRARRNPRKIKHATGVRTHAERGLAIRQLHNSDRGRESARRVWFTVFLPSVRRFDKCGSQLIRTQDPMQPLVRLHDIFHRQELIQCPVQLHM